MTKRNKRKEYRDLLIKFINLGNYFSFTLFEPYWEEDSNDTLKELYNNLLPWQKEIITSNHPGIYRAGAFIYRYELNYITMQYLLRVETPDNWRLPDFPEDLTFYQDNTILFRSITHEKYYWDYT